MSFILEALKKSDKERQQGPIPDLQAQHTIYPGLPGRRKNRQGRARLLLPLFLLGLTGAGAIWYFLQELPITIQVNTQGTSDNLVTTNQQLQDRQSPPPAEVSVPQQQTVELETNVPRPEAVQEVVDPPVADTPAVTDTTPLVQSPEPAPKVSRPQEIVLQPSPILLAETAGDEMFIPSAAEQSPKPPAPLPFIDELPSAIQAKLPELRFAGHTYSASPGQRMIIINNQIKREGRSIGKGLTLEEITWDGIILNHEGLRFQVLTTKPVR